VHVNVDVDVVVHVDGRLPLFENPGFTTGEKFGQNGRVETRLPPREERPPTFSAVRESGFCKCDGPDGLAPQGVIANSYSFIRLRMLAVIR
jgi:hypothetical protein